MLGGEHGVGHRLDALDHDRAGPHRAQPLDVVPRQVRVELAADVPGQRHRVGPVARSVATAADHVGEHDRLGPHERPRPARVHGAVEQRAQTELRGHLEAPPHVALAPTEHGGVDREHERLVPGLGATIDHLLDQAPIAPRVDLEPQPTVADGGDLLDRPGGQRRQRVRQLGPCGGPGRGQLALRVGDPREPGRRQHQRERQRPAEQGRRRVDVADRSQHPRAGTRGGRRRPCCWPAPARPRPRRRCSRTRRAAAGDGRCAAGRRPTPPTPAGGRWRRTRSCGTEGPSGACRSSSWWWALPVVQRIRARSSRQLGRTVPGTTLGRIAPRCRVAQGSDRHVADDAAGGQLDGAR